jgi:hypothetical protein
VGTQLIQRAAQRFLVERTLSSDKPITAPMPVRLLARVPRLQRVPARLIGIGLLPERVVPPESRGWSLAGPQRKLGA